MPLDSTEQRLDTHNAHGSENQKQEAIASQQPKHRESHEVELRDAFFKADFKAGTPAERLERMSKAANDLTLERQELAAAKQKEDDADFWKAEHSSDASKGEKDTAIKAPAAAKQEESSSIKSNDEQAKPVPQNQGLDMKEQKEAESPAQAVEKAQAKEDKSAASPKKKEASAPTKAAPIKDDDDHASEMPSERRSKLDRPASSSSSRLPLQLRPEANERKHDWSTVGEEHQLNHTLAKRKAWHAKHGRERDDPDNHTNGARPTLSEELNTHLERIVGPSETTTADKREVPTATHVPTTLELRSKQVDRRALRGNEEIVEAPITPTRSTGITAKLSDAKQSIGEKLIDAKDAVTGQLEKAEDKLIHLKDEAAERLHLAKEKAVGLKDDAVSKATDLKDDAVSKAAEIKRDAISKKDEISRDISNKKSEISRDIDSKKAEISRDIDSKRADLSRKSDDISRDVRAKSSDLRDEANSVATTIRAQAHTISEDVKSEVNHDIQSVKQKMNEIGHTIAHKKDEIKQDITAKKNDINRDIGAKKTDIQRSLGTSSNTRDIASVSQSDLPVRQEINRQISRDIVSGSESDIAGRRIAPISVEAREKPAGGIFSAVTSWWSGNKSEEHIAIPTHRWSRDPDAKDMSAKLEELRTAEGRNTTGVRSQLSNKWQHIKADAKSVKDDIVEHDWVNHADKASAHDSDNTPSSPRSWSSSSPISDRSPASPIQRSASPIQRSASPIAYRSASPVAASPVQQDAGFFGGFDPSVMDAAVEPW